MYKKNIFIALFCFSIAVTAQVSKKEVTNHATLFPKETTQLVTNTTVLLAGESLLYKIDALTAAKGTSNLSKVAYVTMKSEKDSVVFFHKLKLVDGMANGDFFIPATLKTGTYRLMGYTNFSRNNAENAFAEKEVCVINSFQANDVTPKTKKNLVTVKADSTGSEMNNTSNFKGISIAPSQTNYGKRTSVSLTVKNTVNTSGYGTYSVSVRKVDGIQVTKAIKNTAVTATTNTNTFFIPEVRGEILSGRVVAINTTVPVKDVTLGLTIPGEHFIYKTATTNASGHFFFSIDEAYSSANCVLQIDAPNKEAYTIVLDSKEIETGASNQAVILDKSIAPWLQERSIQLQIENAYFNANTLQIVPEAPSVPFYNSLGTEYVLDDYTRFKTVKETFIEVVTLAGVRSEDGVSKFVVFDAYDPDRMAQFSSLPPLVLMDGMLIQDATEVLDYSPSNIKSIRVVSKAYRYGMKLYSGIIAITTTKGDFKPRLKGDFITTFPMQSLEPTKQIKALDYTSNSLQRIPDYRNQLYWEPSLTIDSDSVSSSFYTSDVTGTFEVVLEGYSNEGTYVYTTNYFTVE